ncbi:MAG: hypothetical protein FJ272_06520, partial [Planctomycetes bacterium]|nr:hypothetical protein [Planctomycetota bacterium]
QSELSRFKMIGDSLARLLEADLAESGGLRMVERAQVDKVLAEIALGETGLIDPAHAVKLGQALPADFHVFGTIDAELASGGLLSDAKLKLVTHVRDVRAGRPLAKLELEATAGQLQDLQRGLFEGVMKALKGSAQRAASPKTREAEVKQLLARAMASKEQHDRKAEAESLAAAFFLSPDHPEVLYRLARSRYSNASWDKHGCPRYLHRTSAPKFEDPEAIGWLRGIIERHAHSEWFDDALWEIIHYPGCPYDPEAVWRMALKHAPKSDLTANTGLFLLCKIRDDTPLSKAIMAYLEAMPATCPAEEEFRGLFECWTPDNVHLFKPMIRPVLEQAERVLWRKALLRAAEQGDHPHAIAMIRQWVEQHPEDQWNSEKCFLAGEYCRVKLSDPGQAIPWYEQAIATVEKHRERTEDLENGLNVFRSYTIERYRLNRVRYAFGIVQCQGEDWAKRAGWAEKAIGLWREDGKDFGYRPPSGVSGEVLREAARARFMLGQYAAAYDYYEQLAQDPGGDVWLVPARSGSTAYDEFWECSDRLGKRRQTEAALVKMRGDRSPLGIPSPYRVCFFGLRDTQAVVAWQGKLICFVRDTPEPWKPSQEKPLLQIAEYSPATGERGPWPIDPFKITAPVTSAVLVNGQVWLSTHGQGLFMHDLVTYEWKRFTVATGLLDDRVCTVAADESGREIWCSFPIGAACYDLTTKQWRTYNHERLYKTPRIYPSATHVRFVAWAWLLTLDRATGQWAVAECEKVPQMPLLRHKDRTYWLRKGRYLYVTDVKGERVGPELEAGGICPWVQPLVVGDILFFGRRRQIFAADFPRNRVVPIIASYLTCGYEQDWGDTVSMAAVESTLYVGSAGGFWWHPKGDLEGGQKSFANTITLISFDTTVLAADHVPDLPRALSQYYR